ncbi:hypothetical protein B9T07_26195 [Limnospira fusiformis CCALA 023]
MPEPIKVHKFKDYEAITATPGFSEGHPFDKDSYQGVIGVYRVKEKLRCCFSHHGRLCNTPHSFGYVVGLSDGVVTIVGNECVNKLADGEKLSVDVKAFRKEESRQEKLDIVKQRVIGDLCSFEEVEQAYKKIKAIESFVEKLFSGLPGLVSRALEQKAKSLSASISVTLLYKRRYVEDGEEKFEREQIRTSVYSMRGMRLLNPRLISSTRRRVVDAKGFRSAYEGINQHTPMRKLMDISKGLSAFRRQLEAIEEFERYYADFLSNDFRYFLLLASSKSDREKVVKFISSFDENLKRNSPSAISTNL